MAVVPICYKMPYKDRSLSTQHAVMQHERGLFCACSAFAQGGRCFSISSDVPKNWPVLYPSAEILMKVAGGVNASKREILNKGALKYQNMTNVPELSRIWSTSEENFSMRCYATKSSTNEKQLRLLDSYFGKLQDNSSQPSSNSCNKRIDLIDKSPQMDAKEELDHLNTYLDKLYKDGNLKDNESSTFDDKSTNVNPAAIPFSFNKESQRDDGKKLKSFWKSRIKDVDSGSDRSQTLQQNDETSDLYLIGTMASINIAVFLFEIASPVRNSEFEFFSLPLLYGAKINDLILVGEWWRLVTPMFLHSGAFHVILGCWSLLTFGPEVCRGYGSFTFFLIYILGGISGNLTSFLHTPEPTVGGTGPIFAIIGAWLIYQNQNKAVISKKAFDSMFQKAIITTAISFILSHFGPIDDWTHLGAVLTGIVYGFLTCPTLQLDDASSRRGQDEGIALVKRYADPCKSLIIFTIFAIFLSSLLFLVEPPLEQTAPDEFIQLLKTKV